MSREKHDVELDDVALSADPVDENIDVAAAESDHEVESDGLSDNSVSAAESVSDEDQDTVDPVEVAEHDFSRWLSEIATGTETDTMLRYAPTKSNSIDITHSQPSGLTQFLSARRTRLTTLLRDQPGMQSNIDTAETIDAKVQELLADRGINVGYLAAGLATWRVTEDGINQQLSAPVLLAPIRLAARPNRDDYDVQIVGAARLNPALVRYFADQYGISLDAQSHEEAAYTTAKLEPLPALELLRAHTTKIRGLVVEHRLLISTFADLSDTASREVVDPDHEVIGKLYEVGAGTEDAVHLDQAPKLVHKPTPLDERDPADEVLVVDLDRSQQQAVDHILAGESLVVSAPPGTGQTQTAVAAAVGLAAQGKRTLVIAEKTSTLTEFSNRLAGLQLEPLVLGVQADTGSREVTEQLIRSLLSAERAKEPAVRRIHQTLRDVRSQLVDHTNSLHEVRERWQCSPVQAMNELVTLMNADPAPATSVRLKRSVLDATVDRKEVAEQLRYAAELGAFDQSSTESPWYGARLRNVHEAEAALDLAQQVHDDLGDVAPRLESATSHAQLTMGGSIEEWTKQVELLREVRDTLDKFTPDIFDRPVTDLIAATATGAWRKEHNIDMSAMTRTRLRWLAREYIRPGVDVPNLHEALIKVQDQLTGWNQWTTSKRNPVIPTGVEALAEDTHQLYDNLNRLQDMLAPASTEAQHLTRIDAGDLHDVLSQLVDDAQTLHTLPERTIVIDQLTEQGLDELLIDFQQRGVTADQVTLELEVAWWQSALEAMVSADEHLAATTGRQLARLEEEFRIADTAHLESGPSRVRHKLAATWEKATRDYPDAADSLRRLLRTGAATVETILGINPKLLQPLVPIYTTSPLALADLASWITFDTVLILDSETIGLATGMGAISRANQVVAFGDAVSGRPVGFHVSVDPTARAAQPRQAESVHEALSRVLPSVPLKVMHRGVNQYLARTLGDQLYNGGLDRAPTPQEIATSSQTGITVEYLTAPGSPGMGDDGVESTTAEVTRTVDAVFEHFKNKPEESLVVIAANPAHARRIAESIRYNLPNHRWAMKFFSTETSPNGQGFVVAPMERAHGLVADHVIFTLGYGRTSTGKVVHHFGPLSELHGVEYYATAFTRARRQITVFTAIHPQEINTDNLMSGAKHFWELLINLPATVGPPVKAPESEPLDHISHDFVQHLSARGAAYHFDTKEFTDLLLYTPQHHRPDYYSEKYLPVAVSYDGATRYHRTPVRTRTRTVPAQLTKFGWHNEGLWAIDVFTDPLGVANSFAEKLQLPEQAGYLDYDDHDQHNYG
ncbi:DUF4011 domain-containing protein [Enteractinococcus helveticum]|uniref:DNA2/NAM7 helicase helicase domain-containing protein n=1 Tax=Enteractinococcus helveticum TaxID=1837282 RepID=A0A1B7LWD2_9MICC|nr:DUF4011 domain-containing protein [Enteractinococcus helveticum]OAV59364.1 hypothetical protein A6F49_16050 [Enteractinococcus helveticum]